MRPSLRDCPSNVLELVFGFSAPLCNRLSACALCKRMEEFVKSHCELHHERLYALLSRRVRLDQDERLELCRAVAGASFSGHWLQKSFDEDEYICEHTFDIYAAEPPEWHNLELEDRRSFGPVPHTQQQLTPVRIIRQTPHELRPLVAVKGYEGSGIFQTSSGNNPIRFQVAGWSLGGILCLEITWAGGRFGHTVINVETNPPINLSSMVHWPRGAIRGTFTNYHVQAGTFTGQVTLERIMPAV